MDKYPTIVVTGYGVVSAIGVGKADTLQALLQCRSGIGPMRFLHTVHREFPVGEVPLSDSDMRRMLGLSEADFMPRTSLMGQLALREALAQARMGSADIARAHLISGTTVGGMDRREAAHATEDEADSTQAHAATYNCGDCTQSIADAFGLFASLSTISTACSSAANAIIAGADKLLAGMADVVVVGGAECLTKFHLNGFNTLMILDHEPCKPFDRDRQGLNLGEGAAYMVMETLQSARRRNATPLCRLAGYGNACDAYHQTASSPDGEGAFMAMTKALQMAGLSPSAIDYINAHGTGTPNNDESESNAIKRLFADGVPPVSSTKSYTGHTTSASGSIEAAICLLAMQHQMVPASLNWRTPMPDGIVPATSVVPPRPIVNVMSNAFGFGGNDSSLIFSSQIDTDE